MCRICQIVYYLANEREKENKKTPKWTPYWIFDVRANARFTYARHMVWIYGI